MLFSDYFNNRERDTEKWNLSTSDEQVSVIEQDGQLKITPATDVPGSHFNGYVSARAWDMTASHARVEVVQATTGSANTIFVVSSDGNNWFRFVLEGGKLYFQYKAGGAISSTGTTYSPIKHRFWRLRHDATNNLMLWETSPDGESWTIQRQVTPEIDLSALYIALNAGTYKSESEPGAALFDNFKLVSHR